jgi:hypothetical protein
VAIQFVLPGAKRRYRKGKEEKTSSLPAPFHHYKHGKANAPSGPRAKPVGIHEIFCNS